MMSDPQCVRCPYEECYFTAGKCNIVRNHMKNVHRDAEKINKLEKTNQYQCANCSRWFIRWKFFVHLRESELLDADPVHRYKRRWSAIDRPDTDAACSADDPVDNPGCSDGGLVDLVSCDDGPVDNPNPVINGDLPIDTPNPLHVATRESISNDRYSTQVIDVIDSSYLEFATTNHLPLTVVIQAIQITERLNAVTVEHTANLIHRLLTVHLSDNPEKIQQIMKDLPLALRPLCEPLKSVNTKYRLETYFTSLPTFVKPVYISFMGSEKTERFVGDDVYKPNSVTTTRPDSFEHCGFMNVSLGSSLSALMTSNPELAKFIQRPSPKPPRVYSRNVDGSNCRNNHLLTDLSINTIALCLTFDDVEVASKGHHKESIFQVSIMNLPPYYSSSIDGMMLVAQGSSPDFNAAYREPGETTKTTGTNILLKYLSAQIKILETHGFHYVVDGETKRMFATLVCIVADNLATHQVYSFAAGFSSLNYPCVICKIHKSSVGKQFSNFTFRDDDENDLWAEKAKQGYEQSKGAGAQVTARCGQKGVCELRTHFWTIPRNITIDVMHDVDYGPVQFGTITLIRFAEANEELYNFTVDKLNVRLSEPDAKFGRMDSSNSFNHINPALSIKNPKHLKFSDFDAEGKLIEAATSAATGLKAAQGYIFLKLIDFLIPPGMIPRTHLVWRHFMRLRAIVMATHSYSLTEDELNEWSYLYETMIVQLTHVTLGAYPIARPKNHYTCHMHHATLANGPPMSLSAYAPERVLGYTTKQVDASGNSSTYISMTSAFRRQCRQAVQLKNKSVMKDVYRSSKSLKSVDACPHSEGVRLIKERQGDHGNWYWASKFTFRGSMCLPNVYMCVNEPVDGNIMPHIVKVHGVFLRSNNETDAWVLVQNMQVDKAVGNRCYGSFVIDKQGGSFELMCLRNCEHHHPMDAYVHWAAVDSNMINPGKLRVYMHSHSRWMARKNLDEPF